MELLASVPGRRLLLGVTPELVMADSATMVAMDWSDAMIGTVWPGKHPRRSVVRGDWLDMPVAPASFGCAMGDGSFNMLAWPDDYVRLGARLAEAVRPGGRWVVRCFVAPDLPEPPESLRDLVLAGHLAGFHAFKWRLAIAVCQIGETANVAMAEVFDRFQTLFPDRKHLSNATGWSLETIAELDDYRQSPQMMSFPTQSRLLAVFPGAQMCDSGQYELAERCPLLVMDL